MTGKPFRSFAKPHSKRNFLEKVSVLREICEGVPLRFCSHRESLNESCQRCFSIAGSLFSRQITTVYDFKNIIEVLIPIILKCAW